MTIEEIIKGLQAVNEHIGKHFNEGGAWMAEFICEAINLLEQQPCEDWKFYYNHGYAQAKRDLLCEDCISREETLKAFAEKCGGECGCCVYNGSGYDTAENCKLIKSMPSVTPQPKTGHWITTRTFMHDGEFYCDKCKCDSPNNEKWDYCPNCGARMEVII